MLTTKFWTHSRRTKLALFKNSLKMSEISILLHKFLITQIKYIYKGDRKN